MLTGEENNLCGIRGAGRELVRSRNSRGGGCFDDLGGGVFHENRKDLDLASFGVVKVIDDRASTPQNCWEPKQVFEKFSRIARNQ